MRQERAAISYKFRVLLLVFLFNSDNIINFAIRNRQIAR